MAEYLFYVSLVFIPIAGWIAYLLHQDGFAITTIIMVLVLFYLMITTFPFSIQHLGTSITVLGYGMILALLVIFLCKPEAFNLNRSKNNLSPKLAGNQPLNTDGGETTVFQVISTTSKLEQGEVQFYTGVCNRPGKLNGISNSQGEAQANDTDSYSEPGQLAELVHADDTAKSNALSDMPIPAAKRIINDRSGFLPEETVLLNDNNNAVMLGEHGQDEAETPADDSSGAGSDVWEPSAQIIFTDGYFPTPVENVIIDREAEKPIRAGEEQVAPADDTYGLPPKLMNADGSVRESSGDTDLADWIELAFAAKAQGNWELAVQNFTQARQAGGDDEIKYLLGMELISILQNIGNYEQAEIILDDLIHNIDGQPDVVMELRQQKQYISLLADELNRLGMSGTPVFEVPRFIRMKVNEKMLA